MTAPRHTLSDHLWQSLTWRWQRWLRDWRMWANRRKLDREVERAEQREIERRMG